VSAAGAILIGGLLLAAAWLVWPRRRRARHASGGDGAGRDRSAAERAESVAGALESIAMCLQAGLTPARSVEIAAERLPPDSVVAGVLLDVRRALLRGDPGGVVWTRHTPQVPELRLLAGAWSLTEVSGSALQPAVAWSAEQLREQRAAAERLEAVTSGARSSMMLMLLLPFAGVPIGALMGIPPWRLYGNIPAAVGCIIGFGFALGGLAGARRILSRALRPRLLPPDPPHPVSTTAEITDAALLLHLALSGGAGVIECLEAVVPSCRGRVRADLERVAAAYRWGLTHDEAWAYAAPEWEPVALALGLAIDHGAAPAGAVRAAARRLQASERARLEAAAGKAGTMLLLPLAAMFLPAFALTTMLPLVLALAPTRLGA
jgi:Flp pilus assembly protein TadB